MSVSCGQETISQRLCVLMAAMARKRVLPCLPRYLGTFT